LPRPQRRRVGRRFAFISNPHRAVKGERCFARIPPDSVPAANAKVAVGKLHQGDDRVSEKTLRRHVASGKLPTSQFTDGGRFRFDNKEVRAVIGRNRQATPPAGEPVRA
jgi:hypothetical protein